MIAAWRRARVSASSGVTVSISLMSLPAQKARPRPATTSTRTSSIAATRSSASSSAIVSRRLSALRASGRLSRSQATPSCASSSTIGTSAIRPGPAESGEGQTRRHAERDARRRGGGHGPEVRPEEGKDEERRAAVARGDATVEEALDEVHRLGHQDLGDRLGERRVGQRRVADVALTAVAERKIRHRALGEGIARRRKRAIGRIDQIGPDHQHERRLPPASMRVLGERPTLVIRERASERGRDLVDVAAAQELPRSEEHTSELQSPDHLVCRLLLEKKKNIKHTRPTASTTRER